MAVFVFATAAPALWGQPASIAPQAPQAPAILRPYLPEIVPPARTGNSRRLADLVRAGALYLTAQDAIALALENNIDIEVARYGPLTAQWQLVRSMAGGPLPGVPSGASQAGSVASGQGVAGSQSAAGVSSAINAQGNSRSANATISQVGPVTQTLDPSFQMASTFTHTSSPQANATQSLTSNLVSGSHAYTSAFQEGFLTGGNLTLTYADHYLNENASTDVLNPSVAPSLSLSIQQNLLNGFGIAVNSRTITVSRIGVETSALSFRNKVGSVTAQVLNAYFSLAADDLDLKAKQSALEVAQAFEESVKRQIEIGAAADSDLITAQSQTAQAEQAAADSRASLRKQELQLKSLLSRNGSADPVLAAVRIVPLDRIAIPDKDDLPPLPDLVRKAFANRPDLALDKANERSSEVSALGTRNGLLPTLQAMAGSSQAGLAGTAARNAAGSGGAAESANPYFVGGIGAALGQVFRRNFATDNAGAIFYTQLGNHQAQSDFAIDQLQLRQTQLATRKDLAQVEVDVMNSVVALQQARAQFDAAVHNRVLQEQLLAGEQQKYEVGTSTPFAVTEQQRDLVNAQSQELAALVAYSAARISLDLTLGTILDTNHVSIADATSGSVARASTLPAQTGGGHSGR
jgi:outer membrane protein TolC